MNNKRKEKNPSFQDKGKRQTYPRIERPPSQLLLIEMAVNYF